jgi:hypothetical protein
MGILVEAAMRPLCALAVGGERRVPGGERGQRIEQVRITALDFSALINPWDCANCPVASLGLTL